ncbi:MAG: DNA-formamidopyrimidine glycosylase family protein, partial [Microbacterium sp.]
MPESPEVQALAEFVNERASGRRITDVDVLEFRAVKTRAAPPESLVGAEITGTERY